MPKVLLIDPPGWQGGASGNRPYPNIGLAQLVASLRRAGHEVRLLDLNNDPSAEPGLPAAAGEFDPDVVGFSVKTATMKSARRLAGVVRAAAPRARLVLGGPHAAVYLRGPREPSPFDAVFLGEAEAGLPPLCDCLASGRPHGDIPGVVSADLRPEEWAGLFARADDLDALPPPEYDLFPESVRAGFAEGYPLITSRGCPQVSGRAFRTRSLAGLFGELDRARRLYAMRGFEIVDDSFNADAARAKTICEELIRGQWNLAWSCPNGLRADRMDEELAGLMARAGCRHIMVGIESGDPEVLAAVGKGETLEEIERGVRRIREAGMSVGGYFIIGLPGDSPEAEERSVAFARRLGIACHFNMLIPYPGTAAWDWVAKHGTFLEDIEDGKHFADTPERVPPVFETADFTRAQRRRAYEMAHTRTGAFGMLIPGSWSPSRRRKARLKYLLQYDPAGAVRWVLEGAWRRLRGAAGRGGSERRA
jgi:radical SAM superfamily enzyme YgiQ (UPF0313 family)